LLPEPAQAPRKRAEVATTAIKGVLYMEISLNGRTKPGLHAAWLEYRAAKALKISGQIIIKRPHKLMKPAPEII
jgi:hypothetical protein